MVLGTIRLGQQLLDYDRTSTADVAFVIDEKSVAQVLAAQHERAGQWAPEVSVPAGQPGSEAARSSVVRGHHVCADLAREHVSMRGDGLVFAQGAGLAVVQHDRGGPALEALAMAVRQSGRLPEVFNTDQGSQFTSQEWTGELTRLGIAISMDNVFIQRLWCSEKHEDIYLREYASLPALEAGLEAWFERYNARRPREAHAAAETPASTPAKEDLEA